ncbi:hypothetical protein EMIHUDRAFT_418542 [Emiliania huxleyi CCMP1516]|uniref:Angio-associated migratory cell protein n=2 Tax=Emiliania huxleyi TaxID=2903 RepID=A0A0D3JYN6_EMIH1|nr:hypothetical protein EMIHUDRAFT_418542 [Emiliania huxleyi CCMP1516]EOD28621.1 hypothetical protein EMIHUDRAFT_418542 [Emiliania huxleyi CCMP1516]|eukprot:XP_005781050.1 hypothetical protein EMIHUDRAFT_418542 [Emiliania huxleyi CCMP1516]
MTDLEPRDTDSVVGDLNEVAMLDDLQVTEEIDLGPDDVPPPDDESELGDGSDLSVQCLRAHTSAVFAVAVNPAQPHVFATGGGDDVAHLWRLGSEAPVAALRGHTDSVSSVGFSADGSYLATGGLDGAVRVWAADGSLVVLLEGPTQGINWVCWHARGHVLLAGSEDATAWMWKVPEGAVMQIFSAHSASVSYGGFANGGRSVITASEDGTIRLWNPRAGTVEHCTHASPPHEPEAVTCLAPHPSQAVYLFGVESGAVKIAHAESGKLLASLPAHEDSVEAASFCECMPLAATGGMDGKLCIWDLNTYGLRHTCLHGAGVIEAVWRRGSPLVFSCTVSKEVRLWDARSGACLNTLTGHTDAVLCLAVGYPEAGAYLVSGSDDNTARVWALDV